MSGNNVALTDDRLEAIRRLHFRNGQGRCAECASTYPCATVRLIDPPPSIWEQLAARPESVEETTSAPSCLCAWVGYRVQHLDCPVHPPEWGVFADPFVIPDDTRPESVDSEGGS